MVKEAISENKLQKLYDILKKNNESQISHETKKLL